MSNTVDNTFNQQPNPTPNEGPSMHDLVCEDMQRRKEFGLKKYGSLLQANNGRDALKDAYEESLDLCVYLKQFIEEREAFVKALTESGLGEFDERD